mmetsp:Transcript_2248/g.4596  ORF Transcript_2248/g.4596 Transcript_2248/m.4596 type:complete len:520 (-) Transcript_2248:138-1697(-)
MFIHWYCPLAGRRLLVLLLFSSAFLISLLIHPAQAAEANAQYLSNPSEFFEQPTLVYRNETSSFHLLLTTPIPALCAVHFGRIDGGSPSSFDGMTTMPMAFPAEFHDVAILIPFETNGGTTTKHMLIFTAFLPNSYNDILRSAVYSIVADPSAPSITTMEMLADDGSRSVNEATVVEPVDCPYEISLGNRTSNSASFELSAMPPLPTLHSLAYSSTDPAVVDLSRNEGTSAQAVPDLRLSGLDPATAYDVAGCFVDTMASVCCAQPIPLSFATEAPSEDGTSHSGGEFGEECYDTNIALLDLGAAIVDVSSNYGNGDLDSSFGGNKAIDGRSASAWSSFGDGDDAYILLKLAKPVSIAGVGVWSRAMVGSAEIRSFRLTMTNSGDRCISMLGPYDLPDTESLYKFNLLEEVDSDKEFDEIRLDVETSTGGNTGLRTLEVYPISESCGSRSNVIQQEVGGDIGTDFPDVVKEPMASLPSEDAIKASSDSSLASTNSLSAYFLAMYLTLVSVLVGLGALVM